MRTLWSLPFASVTRLVASRCRSGVSPSAIDLVAMKVTWLTLGTRSKSPRMNGMLKRPSIGRTSPASCGSDSVPPTCSRMSTRISGARLFATMKPSPTVRTLEIQRQVLEQRLALVERPHRRLVDARADHQVLDLEVLQVAPRHQADLAAQLEAVVDVAAHVEVERQVVDLERRRGCGRSSRSPCSGRSNSPGLNGTRLVNSTRPARTPDAPITRTPWSSSDDAHVVQDRRPRC